MKKKEEGKGRGRWVRNLDDHLVLVRSAIGDAPVDKGKSFITNTDRIYTDRGLYDRVVCPTRCIQKHRTGLVFVT